MLTNILIDLNERQAFKTPVTAELSNGGHTTMVPYSLESYNEGIFTRGGFSLQQIKLPDNE